VARNLSSPDTQLGRLISSLSRTAAIVAPAAEAQASLFVGLDTTFSALSDVRPSIQESISEGPETLDTVIRELPRQRPFLANTEALFRELRPGARALKRAAPDLAGAVTVGTKTLKRSPPFNAQLTTTFQALQRLADDPLVSLGIRDLTSTATILTPTLAQLTPVQTTCNYATLFFRNVASLLSIGDQHGTSQRFIIVATPQGPNNEGSPASAPANGGVPGKQDNYLHTNPYPNTASPGQTKECESGKEKFIVGKQVIGNVPGNQGKGEITKRALK